MISLLFLISYFRVPKEVGDIYYLPKADDDNTKDFLKKSSINIVIFTDNISHYEFTNFAISKYRNIFSFSIGTREIAENLNIEKFPSIVQFHQSDFFSYFKGYPSTISFTRWCKEINDNRTKTHTINDIEELRLIFESRSTVLLGVENQQPPKEYKNDIKFLSVKSNLFTFFNLSVVPGYYVYRGIDRQLVEAKRNYHSYTHSLLVDVEKEDIRKKTYFCGYFIDVLSNYSSFEISILQDLANKRKDMFFGPLSGSSANYMSSFGQLNYIKPPFIVVWNTTDVSKNRWTLLDNKTIHDTSKIESFLDEISSGKRPFNPISEEVDTNNKEQIVNSNFVDKIKNENKHTIVLFLATKTGPEYMFYRIFQAAKEILPQISFFTFDLSKNDIPENISYYRAQPYFLLFKKETTDPIQLDLGTSFQNFVSEITKKLDDVEAPNVNYLEIQTKIQEDIKSNRFH